MVIIFTGKVQGVGFRARARAIANELNISIDALNLPDGSVRIEAHGENLHLLIDRLKREFDAKVL